MRNVIDRILRMGIKLCLLTGVAFTFAACYGPAPTRYEDDPAFVEDQEQVDEVLQKEAEEYSTAPAISRTTSKKFTAFPCPLKRSPNYSTK